MAYLYKVNRETNVWLFVLLDYFTRGIKVGDFVSHEWISNS